MSDSVSFHLWLRSGRRSLIDPTTGKRMTQKGLAEIIGCEPETISRAERGKHLPCRIILREIFKVIPAETRQQY